MIQKYKSLNINSLKTRLCFTGKSYMFMKKHVRVSEKRRTCFFEGKINKKTVFPSV